MMVAIAQRPGLNGRQLGVRAAIASKGGTFGTYLSKMRSNGWLDDSNGYRLTDAGLEALGSYEPLPEGQALLDYWVTELPDGAGRMLKTLHAQGAMTKAELGEMTNIAPGGGTFGTYLSRLRTLELITESGGLIQASEELF